MQGIKMSKIPYFSMFSEKSMYCSDPFRNMIKDKKESYF